MSNTDREELEHIIDRHDLATVLDMLGGICYEKSDHLRSAWQDNITARYWAQLARICHAAETKVRKL